MNRFLRFIGLLTVVAVAGLLIPLILLIRHGVSAADPPTRGEIVVARSLRRLAIPASLRKEPNPVPLTPDVLDEAKALYADHCVQCHGDDGRGHTEMGQSLYPPTPDMTLPATQKRSDGELFAIIRNGVRMTGMPAWGEEHGGDEDNWKLVHLIRRFPRATRFDVEDIRALRPLSPEEADAKRREGR